MQINILAATLIGIFVCAANAEETIPALTSFEAQIVSFDSQAVKGKITAPKSKENVFDNISAKYAGCTIDGKVDTRNLQSGKIYIKFIEMKCEDKSPIAIDAIGISIVDNQPGVKDISTNTQIKIMLMKSATAL